MPTPVLDTLAQPRNSPSGGPKNAVSSDPAEYLARHRRRAKAKYVFLPFVTGLTEHAKRAGSALESSYRSSIYCCTAFDQVDDVLTSGYCKQRWCPICNRIRTAQLVEAYRPVVEAWPDPHFVTLTCRAVPFERLGDAYANRLTIFNRTKDAMRNDRTSPLKLVGLRKTECTYNVRTDTYHLHYHTVTATGEMGERLRCGWLDRFPEELANPAAQDVRPCDENGLIEVLKYSTKLVTGGGGIRRYVPPAALDNIFTTLQRRRLIQPIGFKVPKHVRDLEDDFDTTAGIPALYRLGETILWKWDQDCHDWVDQMTGDTLSGYEPTEEEEKLVRGGYRIG